MTYGPFGTTASLFREKLSELPNLPKVYWENTVLTTVNNEVHLRPKIIPINSQLLDFDRRQSNGGLFSVGIYVPLNKGEKQLMALMDKIYQLFNETLSLSGGEYIVDLLAISRSGIRRDENFCMANIDIEYVNYY
jgi:hypothetical protein